MTGIYNLRIEQGTTVRLALRFSYDTGALDGDGNPIYAALDFTGTTIRMQVREQPGAQLLAEASTADGGITINGDGQLTIALTAAQTANLDRRAKYDIAASWPSGDVKRLLQGGVAVNRRITEGVTDAG